MKQEIFTLADYHKKIGIKKKSSFEQQVESILKKMNIDFISEYRFHPDRKWRFDFANIECKIAIECEGGVWIQGRHNRGKGFINDCEKYNAASLLGWKVLRYTPDMINKIEEDIIYVIAMAAE